MKKRLLLSKETLKTLKPNELEGAAGGSLYAFNSDYVALSRVIGSLPPPSGGCETTNLYFFRW
jgi:hypothetical protein